MSLVEVSNRKQDNPICLLVYGMKLTKLRLLIMVVTGYGVTECKTKLNEWATIIGKVEPMSCCSSKVA